MTVIPNKIKKVRCIALCPSNGGKRCKSWAVRIDSFRTFEGKHHRDVVHAFCRKHWNARPHFYIDGPAHTALKKELGYKPDRHQAKIEKWVRL